MSSGKRCLFCFGEENEKRGGLMCEHGTDGFVHNQCFFTYVYLAESVKCPFCRKLLPMKDLLLLVEFSFEELLMKSLFEEDECLFVNKIENCVQLRPIHQQEFLKMAFVTSVSFGFFDGAKKFHQQLFPRQGFFKRAVTKLGLVPRKRELLFGNSLTDTLECAMMIKFGHYKSFKYNDILAVALFCAVYDRNAEMVRYVLNLKGVNVNCTDKLFYSPIYYSIIRNSLEITKLLLDHGARTDVNRELSALTIAILFNREEHCRLLQSYPCRIRS